MRLDNLTAEAIRLQSVADDLAERLAALERRAETASDFGVPGPLPTDLDHARRLARAAQAAADGARRAAAGPSVPRRAA